MSLIYNGTDIKSIIYNGTKLSKVIYNGTTVWGGNEIYFIKNGTSKYVPTIFVTRDLNELTYMPSNNGQSIQWCNSNPDVYTNICVKFPVSYNVSGMKLYMDGTLTLVSEGGRSSASINGALFDASGTILQKTFITHIGCNISELPGTHTFSGSIDLAGAGYVGYIIYVAGSDGATFKLDISNLYIR